MRENHIIRLLHSPGSANEKSDRSFIILIEDYINDFNNKVNYCYMSNIIKNPEFGYNKNDDIKSVIEREIPALVDYKVEKLKTVFLWPERPQLYILTMVKK